jgi:hypothetical protein
MSEKMVGLDEAFQKGYEKCLKDIQEEINKIRYNFNSLSLPIIEDIMNKLESNNGCN